MTQKKYNNALVFGKFLPMHLGHKNLIKFSLKNANITHVVVLSNDNENISSDMRISWIKDEFCSENIKVYGISYDPKKLDSSSESNLESSIKWSEYLKNFIKDKNIDVLIGSEDYIQYMGEYLNIDYIIYDKDRISTPISATKIKENLVEYWDYLVPSVKRTFAKHLCICGSESSGKTTTCDKLSKELCGIVTIIPEIGRCLVGNAKTCEIETLQNVLNVHYELLQTVINNPPTPIIVWDTDNYTTLSYMNFIFGKIEDKIARIYPKADKYLFFDSTIPYDKDVTRLNVDESLKLKENHLMIYKHFGIDVEIVNKNRYEHSKTCVLELYSNILNQIKKY